MEHRRHVATMKCVELALECARQLAHGERLPERALEPGHAAWALRVPERVHDELVPTKAPDPTSGVEAQWKARAGQLPKSLEPVVDQPGSGHRMQGLEQGAEQRGDAQTA